MTTKPDDFDAAVQAHEQKWSETKVNALDERLHTQTQARLDAEIAKTSQLTFDAERAKADTAASVQRHEAARSASAYEAWRAVYAVLEPLDPERRKRVLGAACALLGIDATFK